MDHVLRTIEANWAILLALVVFLSVATALLPALGALVGHFRKVFKNFDNLNATAAENDAWQQERREAEGLYPELIAKIEALDPQVVLEIEIALAARQDRVFWSTFRRNLLTNFITNLVFFALGVVVTLLTTQPS